MFTLPLYLAARYLQNLFANILKLILTYDDKCFTPLAWRTLWR